MSLELRERAHFSVPAPLTSQFRNQSTAKALSPLVILSIAALSSVLFFTMAVFLPNVRVTLIFTGISIALLTFLILVIFKKNSELKANKLAGHRLSNIEISKGKLRLPNYLKYPQQKNENRGWQEEYSVFTTSDLLDFEIAKGGKHTPRLFLIETKVHGKKQAFQFINPLEKREEQSFTKALQDSLPDSHHLFSPEAQSLRKQKAMAHGAAFLFLFLGVAGILTSVLFFPPVLYYTHLVHLFLYSFAPGLLAAVVLRKGLLTHIFDDGYGRELSFYLFVPSLWMLFAMILQLGNLFLPSESFEERVTITEKFKTKSKNSTHHYLSYPQPEQGSFLFKFKERSSFSVSERVFSKTQIGKDTYLLSFNQGFFALPFIDKKRKVLSKPQNQRKSDGQSLSLLSRLRRWQAQIPPFPKNPEYRYEYWNNKQLKSKEPHQGGFNHGVAYYYHSNGQAYSVITWVKGKKQGRYKTYRKDGSLEAHYSVKNGRLHGLNRWYNKKGRLKQAIIYDDGKALKSKKF